MRERKFNNNCKRLFLVIGLVVFFLMLMLVRNGQAALIDEPVRGFILSLRSEPLTGVVKLLTNTCAVYVIIAFLLILLLCPWTTFRFGIPMAVLEIVKILTFTIVKSVIQRPRPDASSWLVKESGWSFPSGHTGTSVIVFGMLFFLLGIYMKPSVLRTVLRVFCILLILAVGPTRIYLGVHYPTDVLGGWGLSLALLMAGQLIYDKLKLDERLNRCAWRRRK